MTNKRYIRVLWVEDDPMITAEYPDEAFMLSEIELHPFPCWELAEKELEANYDRWDAILLDAKCRFKENDADKADRFLTNAFSRIAKIASRKNRTIPWYVLSGQGEDDIRNLIPEDNDWDEEWLKHKNRRFYSKNGFVKIGNEQKQERHVLFNRIKDQVLRYNNDLQVEYNLYPDVFVALDRLGLESEVGYYLMHLLKPIHFGDTSNEDYNNRYQLLRKALENVFRHMVKKGLLPTIIIGKEKKDSVNLSWSSSFLGGEFDKNGNPKSDPKFWDLVTRNTPNNSPIIPKQLAQWLKNVIFQTGAAVHTSDHDAEMKLNLDKYLPKVDNSPYMLRALTMGMCDFVLWYENFLQNNLDEQMNAIYFWRLRNQKI